MTVYFYLAIAFILASVHCKDKALETLGFESWEEPTFEEIQIQFETLSKQAQQKALSDPSYNHKLAQLASAFRQLKNHNFDTKTSQQKLKTQGRNNFERKHKKSAQYKSNMYSDSYHQTHLNLDEIFESLNMGFGYGESSQGGVNLSSGNFVDWVMSHPQIMLATLLISFGIINLCSCCCCCLQQKDRAKAKKSNTNRVKQNIR